MLLADILADSPRKRAAIAATRQRLAWWLPRAYLTAAQSALRPAWRRNSITAARSARSGTPA